MTYQLNITPHQAALLDGACRSAGLSLVGMLTLRAHRICAQRITSPPPAAPTGGAGQGSATVLPDYTENTEPPTLTC